ncbi:hypothetical protein LRR18_17460, partial [Mangrovimonas sp. AS39]|uniref:hypothetical protein n=1 Tax=Mangrovimonas futianensis TaxID=2895523 RepID=UPI001E4BE01E
DVRDRALDHLFSDFDISHGDLIVFFFAPDKRTTRASYSSSVQSESVRLATLVLVWTSYV